MKRPNILFFMCDQMQAQVLNPDNPCITPNFDYLSSIGTRFQRAYTPNAVCSPARASLMTGLLPHNHGVLWVTHTVDEDQGCLREDKPHWAKSLVKAGYRTGYFGKWHVERTNELERYGWQVNGEEKTDLYIRKKQELREKELKEQEYSLVAYNENPEGYNPRHILYGVTNIEPEKRMMGITTSLSLDFLEEAIEGKDPWCCFVSVIEPHDPFVCGKKAFDLYDVDSIPLAPNVFDNMEDRPNIYRKAARVWKNMTQRQKREAAACYYASITEIDEQFGRLIKKLKDAGQLENTIIILTTDHGEMLGSHGIYCKNIAAYEEIYNIPLIIAGPGITKGQVSTACVGLHDLCQTILELTGCETFDVPDSRSFAPVLRKPECEKEFDKGFAEYFGGRILLTQRVVWDGAWKFIFNGFDFDELYNLQEDPYELNNLIGKSEYDSIVRKMSAQMWQKIKETNDHSLYKSDYPILRLASYGPSINMG